MVDPGSFGLLQTPWREHVSTSDHDELGKVVPGQTMQLDALPEELIDGIVGGESSGYQLADEGGAGVSAPPPLPPGGSGAPPPAAPPAAAGEGSKKTMILAIVVAVLMAVAGVVVGTMVLGEEEAPPETTPNIEFGDIEVQSH